MSSTRVDRTVKATTPVWTQVLFMFVASVVVVLVLGLIGRGIDHTWPGWLNSHHLGWFSSWSQSVMTGLNRGAGGVLSG